jgi:hypothetical protein
VGAGILFGNQSGALKNEFTRDISKSPWQPQEAARFFIRNINPNDAIMPPFEKGGNGGIFLESRGQKSPLPPFNKADRVPYLFAGHRGYIDRPSILWQKNCLVFQFVTIPSLEGRGLRGGEIGPFYHPHPSLPHPKGEGITHCFDSRFLGPLCPAADLWDTIS